MGGVGRERRRHGGEFWEDERRSSLICQSVESGLPETELQRGISDALWKKALAAVHSSSSCAYPV